MRLGHQQRQVINEVMKRVWAAFEHGDLDGAEVQAKELLDAGVPADVYYYALAYIRFAQSRLEEAFFGLHLRRMVVPDPFAGVPVWNGEHISGEVLIWAPPGIGVGAEIMHLGFLPALSDVYKDMTVALDRRLVPLAARSFPKVKFVGSDDEQLLPGAFAAVATILSLGHFALARSLQCTLRPKRYLGAASMGAAYWRDRIADTGASPRPICGISWRSGRKTGAPRDFTIEEVLNKCFGFQCVCLQHDLTDGERENCRALGVFVQEDFNPKGDFSELCNLIAACDLIVTAPNSLAHFSGAMGKQVKLLRAETPPWEWRGQHSREFWYKNVSFESVDPGNAIFLASQN